MNDKRRRIDIVLEDEYAGNLSGLELKELRQRRHTAEDVESQISYYRRLLHGRMDLLNFELRRRGGEPNLKRIEIMPPIPSKTGRRLIDKIMDDGVLTQLPDLSDDEIREALDRLHEVETEMSNQRKQLHSAIDTLQNEIVDRYRSEQGEATVPG